MSETIDITSAEAMRDLGRSLAGALQVGDVVLLHGDLGAGKTTLTQGIAAGLGIGGPIQSPTFTLVREHQGRDMVLYHLDLYRLDEPEELDSFGYDRYLAPDDGVSIVEWPERAGEVLPDRFTLVTIAHGGSDRRQVTIQRFGGDA